MNKKLQLFKEQNLKNILLVFCFFFFTSSAMASHFRYGDISYRLDTDDPTETEVCIETQIATTNINGLVSLEIGSGTSSDDFITIDWSAGPYFIKTATDISRNVSTQLTRTVNIVDVTPPIASVQDITVQLDADGNGTITAAQVNSGWSNDSGKVSLNVDKTSFDSDDLGASIANNFALNFDGTNDYVSLDMSYSSSGAISKLTVEAWVNTSENTSGNHDNWAIIDFDRSEYYNLYITGNGQVGFSTTGSNGGINDFYSGSSNVVNDGQWHHITAVFDGINKVIYIDGVEVARKINPHGGRSIGTARTRFGIIGDGSEAVSYNGGRNNVYYKGSVDELRIWNVVRTPAEIQANMNSTLSGLEAGLVAYYDMQEGTGTTVNDRTGNGNKGILRNMNPSTDWVAGAITVNVLDITDPIAIGQDIAVQLDIDGNATIIASDIDYGSSDDSGNVTLSLDTTSFDCDDLGGDNNLTDLVYKTTSSNGNQSWQGQLGMEFNLTSTITINSLGAFDHNLDGISGLIRVGIFNRDTKTVIPGLEVSISGSNDQLINNHRVRFMTPVLLEPGNYLITAKGFNGIDRNGNGQNSSKSTDNADGAIQFVGGGLYSSDFNINNFDYPTSVDGGPTNRYISGTFGYGSVSGNEVTLTVTDAEGNFSTATATVTLLDEILPTIALNGDATITHNAFTEYTDAGASATDNCGTPNVSVGGDVVDVSTVGTYVITYDAEDASGNNAEQVTRTVNVVDVTLPTAIAQDITVQLDTDGNATIIASDIDYGSSDDSGNVTLSLDTTSFDCDDLVAPNNFAVNLNIDRAQGVRTTNNTDFPIGNGERTLSAWVNLDTSNHHGIGNIIHYGQNDCNGLMYGMGDSNGKLTFWGGCRDWVTNLTIPLNNWAHIAMVYDGAGTLTAYVNGNSETYNIGSLNTQVSRLFMGLETINNGTSYRNSIDGQMDEVKMFNRALTAQEVQDEISGNNPANANLLAHYQFEEGSGSAIEDVAGSNNAIFIGASASDWLMDTPSVGGTSSGNEVTLTVTDATGNFSTATANVTVLDTTAPSTPTLEDVTGQCSATAVVPTTTDNCAGAINGTTLNPLIYTTQGTHEIIWSFDDGNGNVITVKQNVIVDDTTAPNTPTLDDVNGQCDATASVPTTTDNCSGIITGTTSDPLTYSTQGTHTITWNFNDGNGQNFNVTQNVIVKDTIKPQIETLNEISVELDENCSSYIIITPPTVTDNCSTTSAIGTEENPFTTLASSNNATNGTYFFNVNGNTFSSRIEDGWMLIASSSKTTSLLVLPTTSSMTLQSNSILAPSVFADASIASIRINTAGNSSTGGSTPLDITTSNATVLANLKANKILTTGVMGGVNEWNGIGLSRTSGSCTSVTGTLAEGIFHACGNGTGLHWLPAYNHYSIVINQGKNDLNLWIKAAPTANEPSNSNSNVSLVNDYNGTTDASGNYPIGTTTVIWTATDNSGNVITANQNVIVLDEILPTIALNGYETITHNAFTAYTDAGASATDNCGTPNVNVGGDVVDVSTIGIYVITYDAEDASGNNAEQVTRTVIVEDVTPPAAKAQNVTVQLNGDGNGTITAAQVNDDSSDDSDGN
jgi:hypothetical protein